MRFGGLTARLSIITVSAVIPVILTAQDRSRPSSIAREVRGQVRLSVGGAPAENVLVRLENFNGGLVEQTRTDRTGKFQFSGLTKAHYIVSAGAPGFISSRQNVDLETASTAYVLFQLMPEKMENETAPGPVEVLSAKVPAEARVEFEKGRTALLEEKKAEDGMRHLEKAVRLYPDFIEAQLLLGTAYMDANLWDKAEGALRRTLELDSGTPAALFALGEVYLKQKRYKEAEHALQDGLKADARSWRGHLALGRVYWAMGDIVKAGPEVGRVLQLKPDLAEAYLLAGNIYLRARQPENALSMFEEYLRLEPKGSFAPQTRETVEKIKRALAEKK